MDAYLLDSVLQKIIGAFFIVDADFTAEGYQPYRERGIDGFVRFDEGKIFIDQLPPPHEAARVYSRGRAYKGRPQGLTGKGFCDLLSYL